MAVACYYAPTPLADPTITTAHVAGQAVAPHGAARTADRAVFPAAVLWVCRGAGCSPHWQVYKLDPLWSAMASLAALVGERSVGRARAASHRCYRAIVRDKGFLRCSSTSALQPLELGRSSLGRASPLGAWVLVS